MPASVSNYKCKTLKVCISGPIKMLFVSNSDFKELKFFKKSSKELICTATLESLQLQQYYGITLLKNATTITYIVQLANRINIYHSLIKGVLIQSCSAGAKNFTNYVFCHPQFSGVIQNIENRCAIRAKFDF